MILSKKKVLLLNWVLLDVGGITTWGHQIIKGFHNNGFEADHYYATRTGTFKCSETEFIPIGNKFKRGEKIPSKAIGFVGDARIEEFKKLCDAYDYVIFIHPSPHPNKGNLAAKGIEDWKRLYIECPIPKVVIFHDKKWDRTNPWFKDVVDYVDVIFAAQHNFIDSVNKYADLAIKKPILTDWLFFPLDMEFVGTARIKEPRLVVAPQWIKWKNHAKLLEVADQVKLPIHFYNGGMEYHKLCKLKLWSDSIRVDWVEDEYVNKEAKHDYHGFVTHDKILDVYNCSLGSIDLTTRTYQNYTHHECSLYGCVLLCTEECRQGPYNHIHDGEYWPIDMKDIAKSINDFIDYPDKNIIAEKAFERTKNDFDCTKIAAKINSVVEQLKF